VEFVAKPKIERSVRPRRAYVRGWRENVQRGRTVRPSEEKNFRVFNDEGGGDGPNALASCRRRVPRGIRRFLSKAIEGPTAVDVMRRGGICGDSMGGHWPPGFERGPFDVFRGTVSQGGGKKKSAKSLKKKDDGDVGRRLVSFFAHPGGWPLPSRRRAAVGCGRGGRPVQHAQAT